MKIFILLAIALLLPSLLFCQTDTLIIKVKNGQIDKIPISNISQITFENVTSVEELPIHSNCIDTKGNYPNPFSAYTVIEFEIDYPGNVDILIFDKIGIEVKRFYLQNCSLGINTITWDGINNQGNIISSGIYYYQVRFADEVSIKPMMFIK